VSKQEYLDSYLLPYYTRLETMEGKTATNFSQAAFLAFIAEFPDYPINSANMEFLRYCFEQHLNQG
jgi:hypothetical protein